MEGWLVVWPLGEDLRPVKVSQIDDMLGGGFVFVEGSELSRVRLKRIVGLIWGFALPPLV